MDKKSPTSLHRIKRQQEGKVIASFGDLKKILIQDPNFIPDYVVSEIDPYTILLERDGVYKILLNLEFYKHAEHFQSHFEKLDEEHTCIICVGNVEEVMQLPSICKSALIQNLLTPQTTNSIMVCIESLHKLQILISNTKREKQQTAKASEEVKYVLSISRELNGERDIPKLLSLILKKAREVTRADAGSIYTLEKQDGQKVTEGILRFRFTQNDSIDQNLTEFQLPINDKSIVGNAVIHSQTINIPDLYKLSADPIANPFKVTHDRSWDKRIGYESHSMLTIPMYDISHSIIGVIQLINCKKDKEKKLKTSLDFQLQVEPFEARLIEYAEIVAKQAGIALENAKMQEDIQNLFDSFVNASVTAIELRDPTTSGHSHRVAKLTLGLAEAVNKQSVGPLQMVNFNSDQMREIKYASLLHDFGKLGVREHILVKAKKLYANELSLIQERFRLIRASFEIEYLKKCNSFLKFPENFPMGITEDHFFEEKKKKLEELETFYNFICKANEPTVLEQGGFELLRDIANCTFSDTVESSRPYLLSGELKSLSVSRGSLTAEEFAQIQSHVTHTYEFLRKIPWGPKLMNVPQIAAKHHEKLDGSGYPTCAAIDDIPIQSRMMTIADIYDALTASDRPYKKAMPISKALDIINMEVKGGKLDREIFKVFLEAKVYEVVDL